MPISKSLQLIKEKYRDKIVLDENIEKQPEGNRGIYGLFIKKRDFEICAYIGKSEIVSSRIKNHLVRIIDGEHPVSKLKDAFCDEESQIICKFIEPVQYHFDNYCKDAQRLASREDYWIDEKQKQNECLEQVPEGKRPNLEWWEEQKRLKENKECLLTNVEKVGEL